MIFKSVTICVKTGVSCRWCVCIWSIFEVTCTSCPVFDKGNWSWNFTPLPSSALQIGSSPESLFHEQSCPYLTAPIQPDPFPVDLFPLLQFCASVLSLYFHFVATFLLDLRWLSVYQFQIYLIIRQYPGSTILHKHLFCLNCWFHILFWGFT